LLDSTFSQDGRSEAATKARDEHRRRERVSIDMAAMIRLQAVSTRFVSRNYREDAYGDITEAAITIGGADMGKLQLLDTVTNTLSIVAHRGFEQPFLRFFHTVCPGRGACGTALKLRRRVIIEDITKSPILAGTPELEEMLAAGVRAVQCTPLAGRSGYLLGVLSTYYRASRVPDERDLHLMDLLAGQAADIIERIQAEAAQLNMTQRLRILSQAASQLLMSDYPEQLIQSLAEEVLPHLDCQVFMNFIASKDHLLLNAYAGIPADTARNIAELNLGTEICGTVVRTGQRIIKEGIQDMDEPLVSLVKSLGLKAYACQPLRSPTGDMLGTLSFGTKSRDSFREDDLAMMQTLADQIAVALQRKQVERELKIINAKLEDRVAERTRELEATNTELKSYANIVAHDFRTPMVNLKGFSEELGLALSDLRGMLDDPTVRIPPGLRTQIDQQLSEEMAESLLYIGASVDKLDRMINALLKLSRLGRHERIVTELDITDLVKTVLLSYKRIIDDKGVRIEVAPMPKVTVDAQALEQIFGNLIDNAVKYLDPARQGIIRIAGADSEAEFSFSVKDNGLGIAARDQDRIFEIFRRAGRQDMPGEGMGLAYVKTLLRQMGGRVWCQSEVGVGTTMTVVIPKTTGR